MSPLVRNILGFIAGCVIGGVVNAAIVGLGSNLVAPPEGVDPNDIESIKSNMHLYQPKHFIIPFLAHALGALFGGFIAARIAATRQLSIATAVGFFFLIGGIAMIFMLPETPTWFKAVDLLLAYIPMAYLGGKIAGGNRPFTVRSNGGNRDILDRS